MTVVKSNAYGHGLVRFSKEMTKLGVDWLGVDSVVEGLRLREERIKIPVLVLGYTLPERLETAAKNDISVAVSSFELLRYIVGKSFSKKLKIHIKVDSGMHRQGFLLADLPRVLKMLQASGFMNNVSVEGLFTHFAVAGDPVARRATLGQIAVFNKWLKAFQAGGFKPIIHVAATSGAILFPESHFDMVRIGIGMYGLWPSREVKIIAEKRLPLKPILSWKTIISEVKKLPKGESVGYDFTEKLKHNSTIAICPIGYWHGYPRTLSGKGEVLIGGKRAKILGRVSMDMVVIDITAIPKAKVGDEVIVIGVSDKESIGAADIAHLTSTSWYEIVTRINPLLERIYE